MSTDSTPDHGRDLTPTPFESCSSNITVVVPGNFPDRKRSLDPLYSQTIGQIGRDLNVSVAEVQRAYQSGELVLQLSRNRSIRHQQESVNLINETAERFSGRHPWCVQGVP